jgi:large subunit ribosomal protein L21
LQKLIANKPSPNPLFFLQWAAKEYMYAVIRVGGKQYKVKEGDLIRTEIIHGVGVGEVLEAKDVLAVFSDDKFILGKPQVEGATVKLRKIEDGKGKKIIVFKFKRKKRYRRKYGHRQLYSIFKVEKIEIPAN